MNFNCVDLLYAMSVNFHQLNNRIRLLSAVNASYFETIAGTVSFFYRKTGVRMLLDILAPHFILTFVVINLKFSWAS